MSKAFEPTCGSGSLAPSDQLPELTRKHVDHLAEKSLAAERDEFQACLVAGDCGEASGENICAKGGRTKRMIV